MQDQNKCKQVRISSIIFSYFEWAELTGLSVPTALSMIQNDAYFSAIESSSPVYFHLIRLE